MTKEFPNSMNHWNADAYDRDAGCVSGLGQGLVDLLGSVAGADVLDLGCGTGDLAALLRERGARVLGVDASVEMIDSARKKFADQVGPSLGFECADGQRLEFRSRFDHVFSNAALHWMPSAGSVAQGVARALRPGGSFVAEFGGQGCVATARRALAAAMVDKGFDPNEWLPNWYFPSIGEYAPVLERAGLRVQSAWLFERPTPFAGEHGLRKWIGVFAARAVEQLGEDYESAMQRVEAECRSQLWSGDAWVLDYVRLRVVARRAPAP